MLLQTDRHLAPGASAVGMTTAETVLGPVTSDCGRRDPAVGERVPAGYRFVNHGRWLVGLQFHTANSQRLWLYYVVDEAFDTIQAVRVAVQRAGSDPDRVARGGDRAEADQVEVQQILRDALGHYRLIRCL
ncbi:hypothetical protein ABZ027_21375 [Streptomyces sp. NPDC006332]|uniref:hypothetical protein n=1 Tax=Streptomyces sp. NPDC006332 TaxID=3155456 RepID=UPI0033B023A7